MDSITKKIALSFQLKMNKKAFELAISTLILIILGVLLLVALILASTGAFKKFTRTTDPYLDTAEATAIRQACSLACTNEDKLTYCCRENNLNDEEIKCTDTRLEIECSLNCASFSCDAPITQEECEDREGQVIADPGDGSSYRNGCPNGKEQIATLRLGIEGGICCK